MFIDTYDKRIKYLMKKSINTINFIFSIGNKSIINKVFRSYKIFLIKFGFLVLLILLLVFLTNKFYDFYNEKKLIANNTLQVKNEIEYLREKKHNIEEYENKINNLLGYDIYKNYVKNNKSQ